MNRTKRVWVTGCIAFAGLLAVAIWTNVRTTSVYGGAALQQAHGIRDRDALFRSYEQEMTAVRSALLETTVYASIIVMLLFLAIALLWITGTPTPEKPTPPRERDVLTPR